MLLNSHAMVGDETAVDGRVMRGLRNRQAIVDALLSLYHEDIVDPTAGQIAERAGVSVRSVFAHFEDREALVEAVSAAERHHLLGLVEPEPPTTDLDGRIQWLAAGRSLYFQRIDPVMKAAFRYVDEQPAIARSITQDERILRDQIESVFAAEIEARTGPERAALVEALDLAFSYSAWRRLVRSQSLDPERAASVVADVAGAILR